MCSNTREGKTSSSLANRCFYIHHLLFHTKISKWGDTPGRPAIKITTSSEILSLIECYFPSTQLSATFQAPVISFSQAKLEALPRNTKWNFHVSPARSVQSCSGHPAGSQPKERPTLLDTRTGQKRLGSGMLLTLRQK